MPFLFELIYEFLGSIALALFINVMYTNVFFKILFPIILIIPYALAWRVSRAHLNPAITLVNLLRRDVKFNIIQFFGYIAVQVLGHW